LTTPSPRARTICVELLYKQYPAATISVPDRSRSALDAGADESLRLQIPKIEPIDTFTSMLDEPSNGSNAITSA
jgi:hypothetical protein